MKRFYRRGIVLLVLVTLLIAVVVGYAVNDKGNVIKINGKNIDYAKTQGVRCTVDNNLVKLKTGQDIDLLKKSEDSKTRIPSYKLPVTVLSIDNLREPVIADSFISSIRVNESLEYQFEFPYIIKDGKKQIVLYEADFSLIKIPNSDKYIVEKGGLLFLLDPEAESLQFYCLTETKEYSQYNTKSFNGIEYAVVWAVRPSFNEDGTKMIYYSERATEKVGYVWVKDTVTGKENPVPNTKGYSEVLQWRDNRYAYLLCQGRIIEIDTAELSSKLIYDTGNPGNMTLGFVYPHVFIPGGLNCKSQVVNILNNEVTLFDDTKYSGCMSIHAMDNINKLFICYSQPKDVNLFHNEIVVLDMETMQKATISIEDEYSFLMIQPYKSDRFLLNYSKGSDIYNQETACINYDKLFAK